MTTNNLIGYDPLAWLEGEEVSEETAAPAQEETSEPVKKATKSRAKAKKVEPVEEIVTSVDGEVVDENDEIEVDVSVNEEGEISISIETDSDDDVSVEVVVEEVEEETVEANSDEMEAIAQEVESEMMPVEEESVEEIPEEAPIEAAAEPHIDLEKEATIKNVAALYSTVKNALAVHDAIEINAADVASIDTATLQLLVSLKKDAPNLGKTVEIIYPSERFLESAKLLGLTEVLGV